MAYIDDFKAALEGRFGFSSTPKKPSDIATTTPKPTVEPQKPHDPLVDYRRDTENLTSTGYKPEYKTPLKEPEPVKQEPKPKPAKKTTPKAPVVIEEVEETTPPPPPPKPTPEPKKQAPKPPEPSEIKEQTLDENGNWIDKIKQYRKGDTTGSKIVDGVFAGYDNSIAYANSLSGNKIVDPKKLDTTISEFEARAKKDSESEVLAERMGEKKELEESIKNTKGFEHVKALASDLFDKFIHPQEWSLRKISSTLTPSDAVNLMGSPVAGFVAKNVVKAGAKYALAKRVGVGVGVGIPEQGLISGTAAYLQADGIGKSTEEKRQAFIDAYITGAFMGAGGGAVGAAVGHFVEGEKPKSDTPTPIPTPAAPKIEPEKMIYDMQGLRGGALGMTKEQIQTAHPLEVRFDGQNAKEPVAAPKVEEPTLNTPETPIDTQKPKIDIAKEIDDGAEISLADVRRKDEPVAAPKAEEPMPKAPETPVEAPKIEEPTPKAPETPVEAPKEQEPTPKAPEAPTKSNIDKTKEIEDGAGISLADVRRRDEAVEAPKVEEPMPKAPEALIDEQESLINSSLEKAKKLTPDEREDLISSSRYYGSDTPEKLSLVRAIEALEFKESNTIPDEIFNNLPNRFKVDPRSDNHIIHQFLSAKKLANEIGLRFGDDIKKAILSMNDPSELHSLYKKQGGQALYIKLMRDSSEIDIDDIISSFPYRNEAAMDVNTFFQTQKDAPEISASVKGMFEAKGEGGIITLMKSSDITTIYHETAHYFERTFTPEEKAHFDSIYGEYAEGRARSEAFAEGFVRWVADGWYGTKEQHGLFAKLARFIRETFRQIPDSNEANFKLTPQMQLFYRAMLGDEKAKAALNKAIKRRDESGTPSKIKSENNKGAFDESNPNVLHQTGQEVKPEDTLFIRPTDDMKGFWQKWVDNIYKGATAIVDSKKYDDVKWVRRIRENLLLHANRGELYLDHLTEFRMRLTSGYDKAVDLGKALAKELTPIEREILTRKLEGEIAEVDRLRSENPDINLAKIDDYYAKIRAQIDGNAAKLKELGALRDEDNIKDYIKRVYQKQIDEANSVASSIFGGDTSHARGVEKTITVKDAFADDFNVGETLKINGFEYKVLESNQKRGDKVQLKLRRDYVLDERKKMGQVTDASFIVAYTLRRQAEQMEKARLLNTLSKTITKSFADADEAAKAGYVKLPDDSQTYGALSGQYVSTAVNDDLKFYLSTSQSMGGAHEVYNAWKAVVTKIKIWDTVANPATHFGNIMSNLLMITLENPMIFRHLLVDKQAYLEAKSYGLFAGTGGLGDMENMRNALKIEGIDAPETIANKFYAGLTNVFKNMLLEENTAVGDFVRSVYANEDNIFKAAYFGYYKAQYMKKGYDAQTAAKYALAETIDRTIDYTKPLPPTLRELDRAGAMPFVSFGVRSAPAVVKVALRNPVSYMALLGLGWGLFGQDEKDEAAMPVYAKGSHNLLFLPDFFAFDAGENLRGYFNVGRMIPGFRWNPVYAFSSLVDGEPNGGNLFDQLGYLGSVANIIMGKDPRTAYPFLTEDDGPGANVGKRAWMAWREFMPNYLGKTPAQFVEAFGGEKVDKLTGETVTPGSVLLSTLIGKTLVVNMEKAKEDAVAGIKPKIDRRVQAYLDGRLSHSEMTELIAADVRKVGALHDKPDVTLKDEYAKQRAQKLLENEWNRIMKKNEDGKLSESATESAIKSLKEKVSRFKKAFSKE